MLYIQMQYILCKSLQCGSAALRPRSLDCVRASPLLTAHAAKEVQRVTAALADLMRRLGC